MRRIASLFTYGGLLVCSVVILLPFAYLACAALKTNDDFFTSLFLPAGDGCLASRGIV